MTNLIRICNTLAGGCRGILNNRPNPLIVNNAAGYAKSAEEVLGISKPKRPLTPFLKFAHHAKPTLVSKNPGVTVTGVIKLASQHWQQLDGEVKKKFTKEYEKEFEQYKVTKAAYDASLTDNQKEDIKKMKEEIAVNKEKRKLKAEIRELGRPKRPMSSYLLFSQSGMDQMKGNVSEYQQQMTEKWKKLSPQEKAVWTKKAQELKEIYRKELSAWEEKMIRMGNIDFVRNKALMVEKKKASGKTPSP